MDSALGGIPVGGVCVNSRSRGVAEALAIGRENFRQLLKPPPRALALDVAFDELRLRFEEIGLGARSIRNSGLLPTRSALIR